MSPSLTQINARSKIDLDRRFLCTNRIEMDGKGDVSGEVCLCEIFLCNVPIS